ncbi:carboxypeptidase regulatory-like domain-containing protein, partial [Fibrobacterota bacterium]
MILSDWGFILISKKKFPIIDPVNLEPLWDAHYNSFLYYIDQVRYGIQGKVSDALTAAPLNAKVFIENHDKDSSWVYSHLPHGDYYRPVYEGTYDVTFSCDGYHSRTVSGVQVENNKATILDLKLWDISSDIIFQDDNIPVVSIDVYGDRIKINCISNVSNIGHIKLKIVDIYGR